MKKLVGAALVILAFAVGGCGTAAPGKDGAADGGTAAEQEGWKTIETVGGREIIAALKQSVADSPKRNEAVKDILARTDYVEGYLGEPSEELAADSAVQAIEGPAAIEAVEAVYGGYDGFEKEGVLFFENQASGAAQSGIWIGVKKPDDRVQQVLDRLQPKVDAGELLARPIYIFRSAHTQRELYAQQDEVAKAVNALRQERGSSAVSANTISGEITVSHDFLKDSQVGELKKQFPQYSLKFEQNGRMVAEPGQSAVMKPDNAVTETPVEEGGFVMSVSADEFFVSGGTEGAVYYSFPEAELLSVGSRVKVENTGSIAESYPAQGEAKFVGILPDYKPLGAVLSESQAVKKAIDSKVSGPSGFLEIRNTRYDAGRGIWVLTLYDETEMEIEDR
ncbi:DUF3221 domain-containing protein [Sporosarcina sp. NCCP-2716]|uniref:DUF3221 domain-containing protein n=1 Tax=Sporosarcina sp. NCCP-2716 TaxID=2943679 RepID=UPI00203C78C9|nr:DUF3221 domain-containing protein [Sporosarcina sp. NCCP-2716]